MTLWPGNSPRCSSADTAASSLRSPGRSSDDDPAVRRGAPSASSRPASRRRLLAALVAHHDPRRQEKLFRLLQHDFPAEWTTAVTAVARRPGYGQRHRQIRRAFLALLPTDALGDVLAALGVPQVTMMGHVFIAAAPRQPSPAASPPRPDGGAPADPSGARSESPLLAPSPAHVAQFVADWHAPLRRGAEPGVGAAPPSPSPAPAPAGVRAVTGAGQRPPPAGIGAAAGPRPPISGVGAAAGDWLRQLGRAPPEGAAATGDATAAGEASEGRPSSGTSDASAALARAWHRLATPPPSAQGATPLAPPRSRSPTPPRRSHDDGAARWPPGVTRRRRARRREAEAAGSQGSRTPPASPRRRLVGPARRADLLVRLVRQGTKNRSALLMMLLRHDHQPLWLSLVGRGRDRQLIERVPEDALDDALARMGIPHCIVCGRVFRSPLARARGLPGGRSDLRSGRGRGDARP